MGKDAESGELAFWGENACAVHIVISFQKDKKATAETPRRRGKRREENSIFNFVLGAFLAVSAVAFWLRALGIPTSENSIDNWGEFAILC